MITATSPLPDTEDPFATPATQEVEAMDLPVLGAIPPELAGRFFRNGPNARPGAPIGHPFMSDGMLHGLRLEGGRAQWYRNRWVRTRSFNGETSYLRPDGSIDLTAAVANTSVIAHAGRILALVESSFPYEVTSELETVGPHDFGGRLSTPFTAHPKRCPRTGELHAYGMSMNPPGLTYHRIAADGTLVESRRIDVPGVTMMHDIALTDKHVIFLDLPVVFDLALARTGTMPFRWSDEYGARLGVLRRDDPSADVRWFAIEPCYVFHVLNAYDDGETIVLDAVRYPELWRSHGLEFPPSTLHRWTIDLTGGRVAETTLDDRAVEFPLADPRRTGGAYRYGYAIQTDEHCRGVVTKYDVANGASWTYDFGAQSRTGEAVFVPAADDAMEDAGWLMSFVYDAARQASDFVILNASDLRHVATVALPQRVPYGFHGAWIADAAR
jgi:carotenoid cleavage dioxygenase-like enzyme